MTTMPQSDDKTDWAKLAEIAQSRLFDRRAMEWKLAFGFWSGIAVVTWAILQKCETLVSTAADSAQLSMIFGVAYLVLAAIVVALVLLPIQNGFAGDTEFFRHYMDRAQGRESSHPNDRAVRGGWRPENHVWFWSQVLLTLTFLTISYVLVFYSLDRAAKKAASSASAESTTANDESREPPSGSPRPMR